MSGYNLQKSATYLDIKTPEGLNVCLRILFKGTSRICELELIIGRRIDDFLILLNENLNTNVRMSWEIVFVCLKYSSVRRLVIYRCALSRDVF